MSMRQIDAAIAAFRTLPRTMRERPLASLVKVLLAAALLPAGFSVISVHAAITPAQAGSQATDPAWEAGVMYHGTYYQWYPIDRHPVWHWSFIVILVAVGAMAAHASITAGKAPADSTPQ